MQEDKYIRSLRILLVLFIAMSMTRFMHFYFIYDEWYNFKHLLKYEFLQFLLATAFTFPIILLNKAYIFYRWAIILFVVFMGLELVHVTLFWSYPNSSTYFTVFNTNYYESTEFLVDYIGVNVILIFFAFFILLWVLNKLMQYLFHRYISHVARKIYMVSLTICLVLYGLAYSTNKLEPLNLDSLSVFQATSSYLEYLDDIETFEELANQHITFDPINYIINDSDSFVHIVVIGESTSKHHMSLYGYSRETNPLLKQEDLLIFQETKSPNAHTVKSIEKALTFKDSKHPEWGLKEGSIIDLANQVGYKTYWISNQGFAGKNETPISVIAHKADLKVYTNPVGTAPLTDINVLKLLENVLHQSDKKKLIFIHLMGTHFTYSARYPPDFNMFKDNYHNSNLEIDQTAQNLVNTYDNAILYNDYVVTQLLKTIKDIDDTQCTFTYFSDHGEEVYDFRQLHGHFDVNPSKYMYDIPFLFWFNEAFEKQNSDRIQFLKSNLDHPYNTENLIHFFSDLIQAYPSYFQKSLSPFNNNSGEGSL